MFTGLVEEKGIVESILIQGSAADLKVRGPLVSEGASLGDSIAINGCCLTVVAINEACLTFQAGEETLKRTNLGDLATGSEVNLERSLQVGQRMGGHYVSGHIDGLGVVDQISQDGEWAKYWFGIPTELTRQMASKGSVTVDGISLTLVDVETERFSVALIPHTLEVTTLGRRAVGEKVNIETDDNSFNLFLVSTDADASAGPNMKFYRNSGSPADSDITGNIYFTGRNDNSQDVNYAHIETLISDASDTTEDGYMNIYVAHAGTQARSRIEMDSTEMVINEGGADLDFRVESDGQTHALFVDAGNNEVSIGNDNPNAFNSQARNLVVGTGSGANGITIYSANDSSGNIFFADGTSGDDPTRGGVNYSHSSNELSLRINDSPRLTIADGGPTTITTAGNEDTLTLTSTDADANVGPNIVYYRNSSSPAANDYIGEVTFRGRNNASQDVDYARINTRIKDVADGAENANVIFNVIRSGAEVEVLRYGEGITIFNEGSADQDFKIESNDNATMFYVDAGRNEVGVGSSNDYSAALLAYQAATDHNSMNVEANNGSYASTALNIGVTRNSSNQYNFIKCEARGFANKFSVRDDGLVSAVTTTIASISDERIKQDITDANSQWDDIKALKFKNFRKKTAVRDLGDDALKELGVIAQDVEAAGMTGLIDYADPDTGHVRDDATFGTLYTQADEDAGNIPSGHFVHEVKEVKEQVKMVKYSIIWMKAMKALQEAQTRIETLESKVTALES